MTTARHSATVTKGQVIFADPSGWRAAVAKHEGKPVFLTISGPSRNRTLSQNALYWRWLEEIAGYIGDERDAVHEVLKEKFLQRRRAELLNGKVLELPPSTRFLSTSEFSLYMEKVAAWASSFLGLYLPSGDQIGEGL